MELELAILAQVLVFLSLSFGTLMAVTAPRRLHPEARRVPIAGTNYMPKLGIGADRRQPWR